MKPAVYSHLRLVLPLILLAGVGMIACTAVPDTDRRAFNFIPAEQLNAMGLTEFEKIKKQNKVSTNASHNAAVRRAVARLQPVVPLKNAQWEFVVFEDETPNAFALPGGKVGVNSGIFKVAKNEAQLAAVLGHELAHVVAGHSGERMSTSLLSTAAVVGLGVALGSADGADAARRAAVTTGAGAVAGLGLLRFNRGQELEADRLGALYMARAGYDPRESVNLWRNFAAHQSSQSGGRMPEFLRSHPLDATRIQNLEAYMPRALSEYGG